MKFLFTLILPLALAFVSPAQESDQDTTLKVEVKLVNVFVTVTDPSGAPIASLKKEDFQVLEDNVPQKVAVFDRESELPLSIVLSLDTSLSTRKDLKLELESARRFAHSMLRPIDALSLFQFNETVSELVPFTADLRRIDRGIERARVGAATALYDAIYLGSETLLNRRGRKVIVVITDGGDTVSHYGYQDALRAAQQAEAIIYSIIVVPVEVSAGRDTGGEHALIQLSRDTGGKHYYATASEKLDQAFQQISQELRTQYLLAYYPSRRSSSSDFHTIEVLVNAPAAQDFKVRHRTGYYTSKLK